jgi:hypothetical protein
MKKIIALMVFSTGIMALNNSQAQIPGMPGNPMAAMEAMQTDVNQFVVAVKTLQVGSTTVDQSLKILGKPIMINKNDGITTSMYNLVDKKKNISRIPQFKQYEQAGTASLFFNKDNRLKCVQIIKQSYENGISTTETIYKKGNL